MVSNREPLPEDVDNASSGGAAADGGNGWLQWHRMLGWLSVGGSEVSPHLKELAFMIRVNHY